MERLTERYDADNRPDGESDVWVRNHDYIGASERLADYEDTGLTPEQIRELTERDTAKAPEIHKNKFSDAYTCPNCNLLVIHKDETGWFCGKHYSFCPDCGQKLKWED
ncbi:hypothetical protein [[Ruminococcus] torques]|uniref:hypothetical protein n=1 Tax=[Ruminococcus] torques TaxID=33039 RepID=UPI0025A428BC|nr:hypothetical protein [[Ruminococcus] torques]MDM8237109.1 hypothetical protein [[Ruminococcus] torques]